MGKWHNKTHTYLIGRHMNNTFINLYVRKIHFGFKTSEILAYGFFPSLKKFLPYLYCIQIFIAKFMETWLNVTLLSWPDYLHANNWADITDQLCLGLSCPGAEIKYINSALRRAKSVMVDK